jgi:hypothetical protein
MEKCVSFRKQRGILGEIRRLEQLVMMLQENCFTEYFRVYCLGGKAVRIMQYEPKTHLRYVIDGPPVDKKLW